MNFARVSVGSRCWLKHGAWAVVLALLGSTAVLGADNRAPAYPIGELRLIGEQRLPLKAKFEDSILGGLSGLDYDAARQVWVSESDDKSEFGPARFYTLKLDYDATGFRHVEIAGVTYFRQADGTLYPDQTHAGAHGEVPDLESIRVDPHDDTIWYTSEGDPAHGHPPFARHAALDGRLLAELPTPAQFGFDPTHQHGSRGNLTYEGLTFTPDGATLWISMEAPLYEDGPVPTPTTGAISRFSHYDRAGKMLGQYTYSVDPIPVAPAPGKFADNGISELLACTDGSFLVLERSGSENAAGVFHNYIRLYQAVLDDATDVSAVPSLIGASYRPMKKRLLLDFARLGLPRVDNLEGIGWGPRLPNGHSTLVLVSDDNFNPDQVTQFIALEVWPADESPTKP